MGHVHQEERVGRLALSTEIHITKHNIGGRWGRETHGQIEPMTSFCWIISPWLALYPWSQRGWTDGCFAEQMIKAGERKQGGCDLKRWKSLCPRGKLTFSLYKGRYNSVTLLIMDLPELAQSNCSSQSNVTALA